MKNMQIRKAITLFLLLAFSISIAHATQLITANDLAGIGLTKISQNQNQFSFNYAGKENPKGTLSVNVYHETANIFKKEPRNCGFDAKTTVGSNYAYCTAIDDGYNYKYDEIDSYSYYFDVDSCDKYSCTDNDGYTEVVITYDFQYDKTSPQWIVSKVNSIILSRMKSNSQKSSPTIQILNPKNNQVIYYKPNMPVVIDVVAKVSGNPSYVGAHYESNGIMIGGQMSISNGIAKRAIQLQPSDIQSRAEIKVYAQKDGNEQGDSVTIFLKMQNTNNNQKPNAKNNIQNKQNQNNNNISSKNTMAKKQTTIENNNQNKQPKNNAKTNQNNHAMNQKTIEKINKENLKIKSLAKLIKADTISLKIPNAMSSKIIESDEMIEKDHKNVQKGTGTWFKFKYGLNKYILDPLIDHVSGKLPGIGLLKDYFKSDKDTNMYSTDEETKKTAKELGVDKRSAQLYNQFSGIEDNEKKLSPLKNAVNIPAAAKPMEFATTALTAATKKVIARYYKKEYNYVINMAKRYRQAGMKWKDVHNVVKRNLDETKDAMRGLGSGKEFTATPYLNSISKGQYKDIDARADLYILQAMENGDLK